LRNIKTNAKELKKIKAPLKIKISGSHEDVVAVIESLEKDWSCRATSDYLANAPSLGVHIFVQLLPIMEG